MRMWEQMKHLGHRHQLTVVSFIASEEECALESTLRAHCDKAILVVNPNRGALRDRGDNLSLPWPLQWYHATGMRRILHGLRAFDFDLAIVEHIFMAQYLDLICSCAVLQEHNIESQILKQFGELFQGRDGRLLDERERAFWKAASMHMVNYENRTWPRFPLRTTVSEDDKNELERRCRLGKTVVVENGIDTEAITPVPGTSSRTILFMGTLEYSPNVDAVCWLTQSILPRIWDQDPSITLAIAGRNPPQFIRRLASEPRIRVCPDPDDMSEIAKMCCLTVAPMRVGGGTRIKILHSMAMGLPVVSTSLGCEGLSVVDGRQLLIRDQPDQFAEAVLRLISDPALRNDLRTGARTLVEARYDWKPIFNKLEEEILLLVNSMRCGK